MLISEEIVDGFNGIESLEGNFYEDGGPVAHGTIPEAGKLKSLEFATVLTLVGDEACGGIHELGKVELLTLVVTDGTHEVHGIEVGTLGKHLHVLLIVGIDLTALENLQADATIGIVCQERTTTGFAHILYYTTHAHGSIEGLAEVVDQFGILHILQSGHVGEEFVAYEVDDLLDILMLILATIQECDILKHLLLQAYKHTGDDLLVGDGGLLETIGHDIVDILDEDHIALEIREILYQCSMATGTEEELAIIGTEGLVVHGSRHGVGRRLLLAEAYMVLDAILSLILGQDTLYEFLKECTMLGAHGEVNIGLTLTAGI